MTRSPRVLTIPASAPFVETLARAALDGRLVPGWPDPANPLSPTRATILLPNRRTCRALRDAFLAVRGGRATLLPRIAPIGDVDEDEWAFADPDPLGSIGLETLAPTLGSLERRLTLAGFVRAWARQVDRATIRLAPDEPLVVSTSTADALSLAGDLMRLMDQVATENVPWGNLDRIVDASLDPYWRVTREFLTILTDHWPAHLAERGLEEPARRRDALIRAETERLKALPGPIIAAGSTGSILATRDLLRVVAHHPSGALVLPGLDLDLDEAAWAAIGEQGSADAQPGHPQFGLKRLIAHVGVERRDVESLVRPERPARDRFVSEAMRPAATTAAWARVDRPAPDLEGLAVIEAAGEREEALAVALALREATETPGRTAALVTPDRALASRVVAELGRWDVAVDDSGGRSLSAAPAAVAARLVARLALEGLEPATLLALAAQPSARALAGVDAAGLSALELLALRDAPPPENVEVLRRRLRGATPASFRDGDPRKRMGPSAVSAGLALIDALAAALAPLTAMAGSAEVTLAALADAHRAAIAALDMDPQTEGAAEVENLLDDLRSERGARFTLAPADYPAAFDTFVGETAVRRPATPGARVRILGLPEARLLSADRVVLAGLVEGGWPRAVTLDPFMNRAMRAAFGIEPPERRIGLAAHDFCQLLGSADVVLSRAAKVGGVPTLPSRWLKRLRAVTGEDGWKVLAARGEAWLALARALDRPARVVPAARPSPRPPLAMRPSRLSFTEVETFIRDPYAVYARRVLGLSPLPTLGLAPGAAERGTAIHDALAAYTRAVNEAKPADRLRLALDLGRAALAPYLDDPAVAAVWWPRFRRIAEWFVAADAERREAFPTVHAEVWLKTEWTTTAGRVFSLYGKADRIDVAADGSHAVVDYKTGAPPTDAQVKSGLSPQLPLEVAALARDGLAGVTLGPATEMTYCRLVGSDPAGEFVGVPIKDGTPNSLADELFAELRTLVDAFENETQGYVSRAIPAFVAAGGDYDHLARVAEWGAAGEEP